MSVGGLTTSKGVDAFGRINAINTGGSGVTGNGSIQNHNVVFERFGNLTARSDAVNGVVNETYGYGNLNRLTYRGLNGAPLGTTPFAQYDTIGNLTSLTGSGWGGTGTGTSNYNYVGCNNRLSSVTGAQTRSMDCSTPGVGGYDANGNLLNDGVRTMQYTAWNLPQLITKTTGANAGSTLAYDYDASHARIKEVSTLHGTTYYAGGYELVIPASSTANQNQTEERTYLSSPEGTIGVITQKTTANASGPATQTTDTAYWHKDHLGSLVAITSGNAGTLGQVTQRFRFDAWGNRDCLLPSGGTTPCSSTNTGGANNTGSEERGFTGHEMLDEVGLIHMNGRLFDPAIARFTQADPIIQEPLNSQNYNRYSYVLNNPLVYTDPSGYSAWTKIRKPLATVAIMVATWYFAGPAAAAVADEAGAVAEAAYGAAAGSAEYSAAYASTQAAFTMAGGFAAGGISGGNIESAVMGAVQAGLSFGIGEATGTFSGGANHSASFGSPAYAFNVFAHAALGCGMSAAAGGSCKSGGLAGAFSAAAGPVISGLTDGNFGAGLAGRMAAGCVGSYIGKGSCEAGAVTAAFDYIYNACGGNGSCTSTGESIAHALMPGYDLGTCIGNAGGSGACSGFEWGLGILGVIPGVGPATKAVKAEKAIEKAYVVYEGFDRATGLVKYVGITSRDVLIRWGEHQGATGTGKETLAYRVVEGAADLTKMQARIMEQGLINIYGLGKNGGQLLNKINSIAEKYWVQYGIK